MAGWRRAGLPLKKDLAFNILNACLTQLQLTCYGAPSQLLYRIADHDIASPGNFRGFFRTTRKKEYHGVSRF
jgi:hypothetical protein